MICSPEGQVKDILRLETSGELQLIAPPVSQVKQLASPAYVTSTLDFRPLFTSP